MFADDTKTWREMNGQNNHHSHTLQKDTEYLLTPRNINSKTLMPLLNILQFIQFQCFMGRKAQRNCHSH